MSVLAKCAKKWLRLCQRPVSLLARDTLYDTVGTKPTSTQPDPNACLSGEALCCFSLHLVPGGYITKGAKFNRHHERAMLGCAVPKGGQHNSPRQVLANIEIRSILAVRKS